jgi:molybdenum cofactor cytidylyltransferase
MLIVKNTDLEQPDIKIGILSLFDRFRQQDGAARRRTDAFAWRAASWLARGLLCAGSRFVIQLAAMESGTRSSQVAAVVLAAGGSVRMGQAKQLLPVNGQPMVRRVTEAVCLAGLDQVVVVVGAYAEEVRDALAGLPVDTVVNPAWAEGMSTSVQEGLRVLRSEIGAALVVLADQPALVPELIRALVDRYRATGALIVAPFYGGQRGNPVLFDRALFPELLAVQGDRGGRRVIARYRGQVERVLVDDVAVMADIDTRQDYVKILGAESDDGSSS